jgi:nitroimidazol reductase NimA-like FMN-containing flavoprotein (pyridoxamine 5'-phosphate oxidase superfamily)
MTCWRRLALAGAGGSGRGGAYIYDRAGNRQRMGRVAVVDGRGPIALPVNFILDRHMVVFRTEEGTKLDVASRGSRVGFEVDGTDAATRTGWSAVVRGEAVEVTDPEELARLR